MATVRSLDSYTFTLINNWHKLRLALSQDTLNNLYLTLSLSLGNLRLVNVSNSNSITLLRCIVPVCTMYNYLGLSKTLYFETGSTISRSHRSPSASGRRPPEYEAREAPPAYSSEAPGSRGNRSSAGGNSRPKPPTPQNGGRQHGLSLVCFGMYVW